MARGHKRTKPFQRLQSKTWQSSLGFQDFDDPQEFAINAPESSGFEIPQDFNINAHQDSGFEATQEITNDAFEDEGKYIFANMVDFAYNIIY